MPWLENLIAWVNPRAACEREAWRLQLDVLRKGYDAADAGRLNASWRTYNESADATDSVARDTIRARARDMERNSDMANSVVRAFRRNVIGAGGYTLLPRTANNDLNEQIVDLWTEWTKAKNCDVTGQQSLNQMLRMAVQRKKVDGGILFKKCYTRGGLLPFKLQALEVDELSTSSITPHHSGNFVSGGIEYNEYRRPVGYWIEEYSYNGFEIRMPKYYPAKDIIFIYTKNRPSQLREMSDLAPTINRIKDANEYITAVSVKERIAACLAVFIKKTVPTTGFGRTTGPIGERHEYQGKALTPGMITEMNAGDEIQVVDPKNGSADASTFLKLQQRMISAGQGLSYEATARDMSETTYSSARQAIIEDEGTYADDIELMQQFLAEVYETFIISAWLAGALTIPDFWENKTAYLKHSWIASPKKWIDPLKESSANKTALDSGIKSFKDISAEQGKDWRQQIDDMAEVAEYAREKGVQIGGVSNGIQTQEPPADTGSTGDGDGNAADDTGEGSPDADEQPDDAGQE